MTVAIQDKREDQAVSAPQAQPVAAEKEEPNRVFSPRTDVYETAKAVVVKADVPGLSEADVEITLERDILTIGGSADEGGRRYGRRFALSQQVDQEQIEAVLNNGVLQVKLPKAERALARKVEVKRAG